MKTLEIPKVEPKPEFEISRCTALRKRWCPIRKGTIVEMRDGQIVFIHGKHLNPHYTWKDDVGEAISLLPVLVVLVLFAFALGVCCGISGCP